MGYLDLIKQPTQTEWADACDKLAALTAGIEKNDRRFQSIMAALDRCDTAFERKDWPAFQREAELLRRLCPKQPTPKAKSAPGKAESDTPITVGFSVWYRLPGQPEKGPCQVTSLNDLGWNLVQLEENGKWAWIHQSLVTKVKDAHEAR